MKRLVYILKNIYSLGNTGLVMLDNTTTPMQSITIENDLTSKYTMLSDLSKKLSTLANTALKEKFKTISSNLRDNIWNTTKFTEFFKTSSKLRALTTFKQEEANIKIGLSSLKKLNDPSFLEYQSTLEKVLSVIQSLPSTENILDNYNKNLQSK